MKEILSELGEGLTLSMWVRNKECGVTVTWDWERTLAGHTEVDGPLTGATKADLSSQLLVKASGQGSPNVSDSCIFREQSDAASECVRSQGLPEIMLEQEALEWVQRRNF